MKTVDWTKPIRITTGLRHPVTVLHVHNERAFITWGDCDLAYAANGCGQIAGVLSRIENVPEEPRNCIVLVPIIGDYPARWFVHYAHTQDATQAFSPVTRSTATNWSAHLEKAMIVEVPVQS